MKLRSGELNISIGYEAVAALTAVLLLDRENRIFFCVLAAVLHELGHIAVMKLCRLKVRAVNIRLFDVLIEADEPQTFMQDIAVTSGGVCMNLLCAAVLIPINRKMALPHLALGMFNLLPLMSLDGGRLLELLLSRRCSARVCRNILRVTTFVSILPLMTGGFYLLFHSRYNYSLLAISMYLTVLMFIKR